MTERVRQILSCYETENAGVKANLARMMNHGTLAGTGRMVILPVDQGFEHGPARSFAAALEMANDSLYALTGGLYSRSPAHIQQARREFRVGNLYINRKITGALVDRQPFGGFKLSGIGSKAGGPDYLLQFVLPRSITENTMRRGFAPTAASEQLGGV
jgi:hypothetical protein